MGGPGSGRRGVGNPAGDRKKKTKQTSIEFRCWDWQKRIISAAAEAAGLSLSKHILERALQMKGNFFSPKKIIMSRVDYENNLPAAPLWRPGRAYQITSWHNELGDGMIEVEAALGMLQETWIGGIVLARDFSPVPPPEKEVITIRWEGPGEYTGYWETMLYEKTGETPYSGHCESPEEIKKGINKKRFQIKVI